MKKNAWGPILVLAGFCLIWQLVAMTGFFPKLLFPSLTDIARSLIEGFKNEHLGLSILYSLRLIGQGMLIGTGMALVLSGLALMSGWFRQIYGCLISVCDPLPGIALLPLAILWFGVGQTTIIFIIVHAVIWPFSRSLIDGFDSVPAIYGDVGRNLGLSGTGLIKGIYLPAASPFIISGLKTGWARAWRALISAEMIFGATGLVGGLGWHIFTKRYRLDTPGVFAALLVIIVIGLFVEYGLFGTVEKKTTKKWGLSR